MSDMTKRLTDHEDSELAQHTAAVRDAVELPIIVDADTGFGNALNVRHSVRTLERAGANALQMEDQVLPKRCGHFAGKEVIATGEMVGKVKAAVDARHDENFLIIARTDAIAIHGFEDAIERAQRYSEAGADMTFVEAPQSLEQLRLIPERLAMPQMANMVIGGKTPIMDIGELAAMRYAMVIYANAALQGAIAGMQTALGELKTRGRLDENSSAVASFSERQRLVQKPLFDALERKYAGS
jgi:2-methylisocitrate lyase-like PEP mutase family enzyme